MAHALWQYDGLCKHIHGHSYKLFVTIIGEANQNVEDPKLGMVLDFSDLKSIVKEPIVDYFDHSLVVYEAAAGHIPEEKNEMYEKMHIMDFQPTCENLVLYIAKKVGARLPSNIRLFSVKLYETATSFAEWYATDNQ